MNEIFRKMSNSDNIERVEDAIDEEITNFAKMNPDETFDVQSKDMAVVIEELEKDSAMQSTNENNDQIELIKEQEQALLADNNEQTDLERTIIENQHKTID